MTFYVVVFCDFLRKDSSMENNFILKTDSYKHSHYKMYPQDTTNVYSYFESRGGPFEEIVFFGLQYLLKKHFVGEVVTKEHVDQAEKIVAAHMGPEVFNREGWDHIVENCGGKLPLRIKALPEGTITPTSCVLMTVENTDPKCAFLTNFAETILVQAWYPTTVATNSREMLKVIKKYLEKTADNTDGLPFKLHDFGMRGSTSLESSGIGGCAHLVNSMGTDTMSALIVAAEYYNAEMAGFSIPATEHSIMCSWTKAGEFNGVKNLLEAHPTGLVACVSDTYDIYNACRQYTTELKDLILSREGTFVVRPDSGHPPTVVINCLNILCKGFEDQITMVGENKKYKLLPPQIRLIQGDGIDLDMLEKILAAMERENYSADNIAFGSGGGLLQNVNRDTLKMAFKASSYIVDNKRRDERKDPITSAGKRSKKGRFKVIDADGMLKTVPKEDLQAGTNLLITVFEDGELKQEWTLDEIRKRAKLL